MNGHEVEDFALGATAAEIEGVVSGNWAVAPPATSAAPARSPLAVPRAPSHLPPTLRESCLKVLGADASEARQVEYRWQGEEDDFDAALACLQRTPYGRRDPVALRALPRRPGRFGQREVEWLNANTDASVRFVLVRGANPRPRKVYPKTPGKNRHCEEIVVRLNSRGRPIGVAYRPKRMTRVVVRVATKRVVRLPRNIPAPGQGYEDAPDESGRKVSQKVSSLRRRDRAEGHASATLTLAEALALVETSPRECPGCGCALLYAAYADRCAYQFSLDRIDWARPHAPGNVRVVCWGCNRESVDGHAKTCPAGCHANQEQGLIYRYAPPAPGDNAVTGSPPYPAESAP